jgi:hypothetical protein
MKKARAVLDDLNAAGTGSLMVLEFVAHELMGCFG